MKNLVWITHSFRMDSRLMNNLEGECTFVYYSPFYFSGERERNILSKCSQLNLDCFYYSLHQFDEDLKRRNQFFYIFKESDPISHINSLAKKYSFDKLIIDQPLFAMWHSLDMLSLDIPFEIIDSDLIDETCYKMTAKSRWMSHARKFESEKYYKFNQNIISFEINESSKSYPKVNKPTALMDREQLLIRLKKIFKTYISTRDRHDGQTQLSTALQNGIVDPHNVFLSVIEDFKSLNADFSKNEGAHAAMLRQFTFREINIIYARRNNLTMENTPIEWAKTIMHSKAYENLISSTPKPESNLTIDSIRNSNTGISELDRILTPFNQTGIMPNRARMYYAGKIFYESKSGIDALNLLIDTFDLIGLDGQCPNNYMQCISSLGLSYGKVMLMSSKRTFELLDYPM
jgi:deoxyribodipyrimidine photolyase